MTSSQSPLLLRIKALHPDLGGRIPLPKRMSAHASGIDIAAALDEPLTLAPGERALVPTGFAMALPSGYEGQIRPRSGLAHKYGVTVLNAPGTIDSDYRGEVKVLLVNLGDRDFEIKAGERVAQLVVAPVNAVPLEVTTVLDATDRGAGGFGSTGS